MAVNVQVGGRNLNNNREECTTPESAPHNMQAMSNRSSQRRVVTSNNASRSQNRNQQAQHSLELHKKSSAVTTGSRYKKPQFTYEQRQQHILDMYSRTQNLGDKRQSADTRAQSTNQQTAKSRVALNKGRNISEVNSNSQTTWGYTTQPTTVKNGVKSMFSNNLVSEGEDKFSREFAKMVMPTNQKNRKQQVNREIFEEVQRNLPIYSEQARSIQQAAVRIKPRNYTSQSKRHKTRSINYQSQMQFDPASSIPQTDGGFRETSPIPSLQQAAIYNQKLQNYNAGVSVSRDQGARSISGSPPVNVTRQVNSSQGQNVKIGKINSRSNKLNNVKSTILNKKLASNQSNMMASAGSNLREMRPQVCTPVEDQPLEQLLNGFYQSKRPPGTATGSRRPYLISNPTEKESYLEKDFYDEKLSLAPFVKEKSKANLNKVAEGDRVQSTCLLSDPLESEKNKEKWLSKPLVHLIDLMQELDLNYDMFEHEDGRERLNDPVLTRTELDRHKLANWAYRVHQDVLTTRDLDFPDAQLPQKFTEIGWILRSCLILFKDDPESVRIIAILWKTIITSVDMELISLHNSIENYEERIWEAAAKKYQTQFNAYQDQVMTLERKIDEQCAENDRLSKIVKESSGVEDRLNHSITDILNYIENMKNPRDFNKFKMELMQCIDVMENLDHNKEFQLGLQRKSIQLMRKNMKVPDKIIIHADGTQEEVRRDTDLDEEYYANWHKDNCEGNEIIYNNIYGMNPAYGSTPYDIEDVAATAKRYNDVIYKAIAHSNEEFFNSVIQGKLTQDEIKLLKNKMAQELTPLIDFQVRDQCADQMKKIIDAQRMKLIEKLSKTNCRHCGKKQDQFQLKGKLLDLDSDSDLDVLLKGMRAGADLMKKNKKEKIRRARERENSDSDYDVTYNSVTGEHRRKKKVDKDLYEIDTVTGKPMIDITTGKAIRNKNRPKRKDHYSTGESSFADEDIYQVDPKTGKFKRNKKTNEILRRPEDEMYEIDMRTGRPKIDPSTGNKIRKYDSDNYVKDSDGEIKIDAITGRKVRKQKIQRDDYEQDAFGKPIFDEYGRPKKVKRPVQKNAKGEVIVDSESEYEFDIVTGKPRIDPRTGWPVRKTKDKRKKAFAEDDYAIDPKTGKVVIDVKTGRPVRKMVRTKKDKKGRLVEESDETEFEIDPETGKPMIDPTTGWPVPKYERDKLTGAIKIDPRTGKKLVMKRKIRNKRDPETEYELDDKGNKKIDPVTKKPIIKYQVDPKTGKKMIDPSTGKFLKMRKKFESEGETDYEVDEKTGKVKMDSDGKPIPKLEYDINGKVKINSITGKPMTKRVHKKDQDDDDGAGSSYEVDWKNGKYVVDPATGKALIDAKSGRKWKVIRKGANKEYSSDEYKNEGGIRKRKGKKGAVGEPEEMTAAGIRNLTAKISMNLGKAAISKNAAIKKQTIKEMKNPIMDAIEKTLGVGKRKLGKEYFIQMKSPQMFEIMDNMMCEKALADLKAEQMPIKDRRITPYATFMYDTMLMQYGLPQLAVKVLFQLTNGIRSIKDENPFALILNQMLGMDDNPLRLDEIGIVLRSHLFFKIQQENWVSRLKLDNRINPSLDNISNLNNGGEMCIFDLIEELKIALQYDKEVCERVLTQIKPDCLLNKVENRKQLSQEFTVLKVAYRVSKMGKDPTWIFEKIDYDKSGTLSPQEILQGCRSVLGVYFSTEEANLFTSYLDEDGSGDVDLEEFTDKVSLDNLQQKIHRFLISECTFIEKMLNEWYFVQKREKKQVFEVVKKYDDNGDGVFQLDEFKHMLKDLEPEIDDKKIMNLFKTSMGITSNGQLNDAINQEVLFMTFTKYKISGFGKGFFSKYLTDRMDKIKADRRKKK